VPLSGLAATLEPLPPVLLENTAVLFILRLRFGRVQRPIEAAARSHSCAASEQTNNPRRLS
jgi:hypothetical protein